MRSRPDLPFAPKRIPFFYGWVIVGVSILAIISSMPGQTIGVGPFIDGLLLATGLNRTQISTTYLLGTLLSALILPYAGTRIDRCGCRRMLGVACLIMAVILCCLSQIDYLGHGLGRLIGDPLAGAFIALTLAFAALRFSGQGLLTVVAKTMIGKWFEVRRGLVSAITGTVIAGTLSFIPIIFYGLIWAFAWRGAWLFMALVVGLGMGLIAWVFARDNPEQCGLKPDGKLAAGRRQPRLDVTTYHHASRRQAMGSIGFWAIAIILSTHSLAFTALSFHIIALGDEVGLSEASAASLFIPMAIISPTVGFVVGLLCDYVRIKWLLIINVTAQLLALTAAHAMDFTLGRWVAIICFAISGGFFGPLSTVAMPRFFGRSHLGAINGALMTGVVVGSALGPLLLSLANDASGRLSLGFWWALALPLTGLLLAMAARNPQEHWRRQPPS